MENSNNGPKDTKKHDRRRKLTPGEEAEIEERLEKKESPKDIAEDYPVTAGRVSQIRSRLIVNRLEDGDQYIDTIRDFGLSPSISPEAVEFEATEEAPVLIISDAKNFEFFVRSCLANYSVENALVQFTENGIIVNMFPGEVDEKKYKLEMQSALFFDKTYFPFYKSMGARYGDTQ